MEVNLHPRVIMGGSLIEIFSAEEPSFIVQHSLFFSSSFPLPALPSNTLHSSPRVVPSTPNCRPHLNFFSFHKPDGPDFAEILSNMDMTHFLLVARWVVTAAHCTYQVGDRILFNRWNLSAHEPQGEVGVVKKHIRHEKFDPNNPTDQVSCV